MKLIVISSPFAVPNEVQIINSLFEKGMETFHIHKPDFNKEKIKDFIQQIPSKHQNKIFLHSDFPKFHSLEELENYKGEYDYAFLSPIFDSISKQGYKSSHEFHELTRKELVKISVISGKNIIGLGGIDEDKIALCRKFGFAGVAVLGAIWKSENPIEKFLKLKSICHSERSEESIDASLRSA